MRLVSSLTAAATLCLLTAGPALADGPGTNDTVGRTSGGRVVTAQDQVITPAGRQVEFAGRPDAVALDPHHPIATLLDSKGVGLEQVNLTTGAGTPFNPGSATGSLTGITYTPDGTKLLASFGTASLAVVAVNGDGSLGTATLVTLPANSLPAGIAVRGTTAYVVLEGLNELGVVDLTTGTVTAQIPVGVAPFGVALSAEGSTAYVSNEGGRPAVAGDTTNTSFGTAVVTDDAGRSGSSTGTVSVVDLASATQTQTIAVGLHPTNLNLSGSRLYVVDSQSDQLSVIDTAARTLASTIAVTPYPQAPYGSAPTDVKVLGDGRLAVTLGRNNAVAFFSAPTPTAPASYLGLLPTASNPAALVEDPSGHQLVVANDKGVGNLGANGTAVGVSGPNSIAGFVGSASLIPVPDTSALVAGTNAVTRNNGWDTQDTQCARPGVAAKAIPLHAGEPSLITHVFYITKENRTYDQVLGDDTRGNGSAALTVFGKTTTPNQHALVTQYPLLDNFYDSGQLSADGHNWADQGDVPQYVEDMYSTFTRSYPASGLDPLAYQPSGFIWENALRHGKTVKDYGEYANYDTVGQTTTTDVPSLQPLLDAKYPGFALLIPDQQRMSYYLSQLQTQIASSAVPNLTLMTIPDDHTAGLSAQSSSAEVADNDLAVGELIQALSRSSIWNSTAVFIAEDDAQNGVDHVDGHRTTAYVASPYAKAGVDHTYYTQVNMLRTVEQILGLPPMNQMDLAAQPMRSLFTDTPDNGAAFTVSAAAKPAAAPQIPAAQTGVAAQWAAVAKGLDLRRPDTTVPAIMNRLTWYEQFGFTRPYPGDTKILTPPQVQPDGNYSLVARADSDDPTDGGASRAALDDVRRANAERAAGAAAVPTVDRTTTVAGFVCTQAVAAPALPETRRPVEAVGAVLLLGAAVGLVRRRRSQLLTARPGPR